LHIARALQHVGRVETVVVDSLTDGAAAEDVLGSELVRLAELSAEPQDNGIVGRIRRIFDPRSPLPHAQGVGSESERRLVQVLDQFDLVWVFKLRTANMFRFWRWPHSVLDVDDLPSGIYATSAHAGRPIADRIKATILASRWRRHERLLGERFEVLTVCSDADRRILGAPVPVHVIPNGFDPPTLSPRRPAVPPRLGFIGLFDHQPNVEGVRWFIQRCWPRIRQALPGVRLRLAGRFSDSVFRKASPDVDALGWVEDADQEIATWTGMIVPILFGGGTRVKVAEGFSRKCPIVTTSIGAYGYDVIPSVDLLMSDDAQGFADACVALCRDPAGAALMAERAHAKYLQRWTWNAIAPRVWRAAEDCLSRTRFHHDRA
jgi:glycosyltransferase involved in cell wall biosynthesis